MNQVYYLHIRNGEFRRAGGMYVATYDGDLAVATETIINEGYSFLMSNETYLFFVKVVDEK